MPRFVSYLEVLIHVSSEFKKTDKLSRNFLNNCFYSHNFNGVGCAIGCCLSAEDAVLIQEHSDYGDGGYIGYVLTKPYGKIILGKYFASTISSQQLARLQSMHDRAIDVDDFQYRLQQAISNEVNCITE